MINLTLWKDATLVALALAVLSGCNAPAVQLYKLESLMDSRKHDSPPPAITAQIAAIEKQSLQQDKDQHLWSNEGSLLAAVPVNLNDDGITDYLVYPASYLPTFFGAHSISCWVFKGSRDGTYDLVLSGRHDAVMVLSSKTHGFYDIDLIYWAAEKEVYPFRYDGHRYKEGKKLFGSLSG